MGLKGLLRDHAWQAFFGGFGVANEFFKNDLWEPQKNMEQMKVKP